MVSRTHLPALGLPRRRAQHASSNSAATVRTGRPRGVYSASRSPRTNGKHTCEPAAAVVSAAGAPTDVMADANVGAGATNVLDALWRQTQGGTAGQRSGSGVGQPQHRQTARTQACRRLVAARCLLLPQGLGSSPAGGKSPPSHERTVSVKSTHTHASACDTATNLWPRVISVVDEACYEVVEALGLDQRLGERLLGRGVTPHNTHTRTHTVTHSHRTVVSVRATQECEPHAPCAKQHHTP